MHSCSDTSCVGNSGRTGAFHPQNFSKSYLPRRHVLKLNITCSVRLVRVCISSSHSLLPLLVRSRAPPPLLLRPREMAYDFLPTLMEGMPSCSTPRRCLVVSLCPLARRTPSLCIPHLPVSLTLSPSPSPHPLPVSFTPSPSPLRLLHPHPSSHHPHPSRVSPLPLVVSLSPLPFSLSFSLSLSSHLQRSRSVPLGPAHPHPRPKSESRSPSLSLSRHQPPPPICEGVFFFGPRSLCRPLASSPSSTPTSMPARLRRQIRYVLQCLIF